MLVESLDLEGLVEAPLPASSAEVEAGVHIKVPRKGFLARERASGHANREVEVGLVRGKFLGEKTAVRAETVAALLEVGSLELDASTGVHTKERHEAGEDTNLLVNNILRTCVCRASLS
jgi:hypothetical protein